MGSDGRLSAKILPKLPYLRACQVLFISLNDPSRHISEMKLNDHSPFSIFKKDP